MKTLFTFFLLIYFSFTGLAQTYKPFPTSNAVWRESKTGFQCSCCSDYQIFITGDTIISATTYHKLHKTGIKYQEDLIGNCTSIIQSNINQYVGCFRNDSTNKQVYFIPPFTSNDTLLYDFNLELGDTNKTYLNGFTGEDWIVTNIDSVLLGSQYHRRLKLNNCSPKTLFIIEGIGSTFGLLSPFICWAPYFEHIYDLQCFKLNNLTVYPDSATVCILASSVNESFIDGEVSVFPNPSSEKVFITSNFHSYDISIFNATGQLIYKKFMSSNSTQIDISEFPTGLYLIRLSENDKTLYKQTIIRL
jgi:hypothetical protein